MRVLGIETSCDETGIAIYSQRDGLMAHRVHSQIDVHAHYGGVVPELASRDHVRYLRPLVDETVAASGLDLVDIDAVAYTTGPGLLGALLVGATFGKALAFSLDRPALGIHHMEGHLLAPLMETPDLQTPFVALLVSGGHSQLILVRGIGDYQLLGRRLMMRPVKLLIKQRNYSNWVIQVALKSRLWLTMAMRHDFVLRVR